MIYAKTYLHPARTVRAVHHHRWLASLGTPITVPALLAVEPLRLEFEQLPGRTASHGDLVAVAAALGQLDAAASNALPGARLDQPHPITAQLTIPDFWTPRARLFDAATVTAAVERETDSGRVAIYKDANLRNIMISPGVVAIVDFDDLTLAPPGYDLAKFLISLAMTDGELTTTDAGQALAAYNRHAHFPCSRSQFVLWCELNWLLTAAYVGRHYPHTWPSRRPWADPFSPRSSP